MNKPQFKVTVSPNHYVPGLIDVKIYERLNVFGLFDIYLRCDSFIVGSDRYEVNNSEEFKEKLLNEHISEYDRQNRLREKAIRLTK